MLDKEKDFYAWCMEVARRLRRLGDPLMDAIAEELEVLGRNEVERLRRHLESLYLHVLKWKYQPSKRTRRWAVSMTKARLDIRRDLDGNRGLKKPSTLKELHDRAYSHARIRAAKATGLQLSAFPEQRPWSHGQVMKHQRLTLRRAGTPGTGAVRGWQESVIKARLAIEALLTENPELRARLPELHLQSYAGARELAALDLGLKREDLPEKSPWTQRQMLDRSYWPKSRAK